MTFSSGFHATVRAVLVIVTAVAPLRGTAAGQAASTIVVSGRVVSDATGGPLRDIRIYITPPNMSGAANIIPTVTDTEGRFEAPIPRDPRWNRIDIHLRDSGVYKWAKIANQNPSQYQDLRLPPIPRTPVNVRAVLDDLDEARRTGIDLPGLEQAAMAFETIDPAYWRRNVFESDRLTSLRVALRDNNAATLPTGINGTVLDARGDVIPGAAVEIRNTSTSAVRSVMTDATGQFSAVDLEPGNYVATTSVAGFSTRVETDILVMNGGVHRLTAEMRIGDITEEVTVAAARPDPNSGGTVDNVITRQMLQNLPLAERNFAELMALIPRAASDSVYSVRGAFPNVSLDGTDFTSRTDTAQTTAGGNIALDSVSELQLITAGARAEFGRTSGGVLNVTTQAGTSILRGSLFHYQRLKALTSPTSDGVPLDDYHRAQLGGTVGGPIVPGHLFFFVVSEGLIDNLLRRNLSTPIGTPCPTPAPTLAANESLINGNPDCQRLALVNVFKTSRASDEAAPVQHRLTIGNLLGRLDYQMSSSNRVNGWYSFTHRTGRNQAFDVATYGASANSIDGPSTMGQLNLMLSTTLSPFAVNDVTTALSHNATNTAAVESNVPADTGIGFAPSFRFGNPFFVAPNASERAQRFQIKDSFSLVKDRHSIKIGGDWLYTKDRQLSRAFFGGRYLFDSAIGFLRYTSAPASGGYGPYTVGCAGASGTVYVTAPASCPAGTSRTGGPLLSYIQSSGPDGLATDAAGQSVLSNHEMAVFVQDNWRVTSWLTLDLGLRWDGQLMADTLAPADTAFAASLNDRNFPSDGTIPDQLSQFQPRLGVSWDIAHDGKSILRASTGVFYARQGLLAQSAAVTNNGAQQRIDVRSSNDDILPVWPNLLPASSVLAGTFPPLTGIRVFHRDYRNPRSVNASVGYEREIGHNLQAYTSVTVANGTQLTRFLNYNNHGSAAATAQPPTRDTTTYAGSNPFARLGDVFVTTSRGRSLSRGVTLGLRHWYADRYQFDVNYVLAKDEDDDSNERDPYTDRSFNFYDLALDYGPSDRDVRHRFSAVALVMLPLKLEVSGRVHARSAQPFTSSPRVLNGYDRGRNWDRKDNAYSTFDWRLQRPFRIGTTTVTPSVEMFNTFNSANNIDPLYAPMLYNTARLLRVGVGDPRIAQLVVRATF